MGSWVARAERSWLAVDQEREVTTVGVAHEKRQASLAFRVISFVKTLVPERNRLERSMRTFQPQPFHLFVECRAVDPQCIGRRIAIPIMDFQRLQDDLPFRSFKSLFECLWPNRSRRRNLCSLRDVRRQVAQLNLPLTAKENRSLNNVL